MKLVPIFLSAAACAPPRQSLAFSPPSSVLPGSETRSCRFRSSYADDSDAATAALSRPSPPEAYAHTVTRLLASESTETEVERLQRRAKELREELRREEENLHSSLIEKKRKRDEATDATISHLFGQDNGIDGVDGVDDVTLVDRLRKKRQATDALVKIVVRLHEREVAARGLEHVESSVHRDQHVTFERVAEPNEAELLKVAGCVDRLIGAARVLDAEFHERKSQPGKEITHADMVHWGGGDVAKILSDKSNELGREHDEQFQKRQGEFYDAAVRKHSAETIGDWKLY